MLSPLAYDAYGIPRSTNTDRFGYTGQIWFKELGLFHYKARMYHPKLGRFLQTDPIGYKDDMDLYSYVGNDPVNKTDPTGMVGCTAANGTHYSSCTITVTYDKKTSQGTLTVTGQNKKDKEATTLFSGGVTVGGKGHETPTGDFTAGNWGKDATTDQYGWTAKTPWGQSTLGLNAFGPYQLHIKELEKRGVWIHGTMGPGWSNRREISGYAVSETSHGCIRQGNADNLELHKMMPDPKGNPIKIRAEEGAQDE